MESESVLSFTIQSLTLTAQNMTPRCIISAEPESEVYNNSTESDTLLRYTVQRVTMRCKTEHGV